MFNHYLKINRIGAFITLAILLTFTLTIQSIVQSNKTSKITPLNFSNFPKTLGEWKGEDSIDMDKRSLDVLQLSSYIRRVYTHPSGASVFLYIGYWDKQSGEYQAAKHSPALCLPSNGWITNNLVSNILDANEFKTQSSIEARRIVGEKNRNKELFYYWFFAGKDYYSSEWYALIKLSLENILYGRSDGGIVEISAPFLGNSTPDKADETIRLFLKDLAPYVDRQINTPSIPSS